jgi:hypothetical protein
MPALDPDAVAGVVMCQLIEDAIEYRRGRAAGPCAACDPAAGGWCADHADDLVVIGGYQARYEEAYRAAVACLDPADVRLVMGDDCLDRTAGLHGVVMLCRMREIAAAGPVLMNLEGRDVLIEADGDRIGVYPLEPPRAPEVR